MKKTTLYAVALVVVLALLAGVLVWQKGKKTIPEQVVENTPVEQVEPLNTADWKTYRNEEYGFGFEYPGDMEVVLNEDPGSIWGSNEEILKETILQKDGKSFLWVLRTSKDSLNKYREKLQTTSELAEKNGEERIVKSDRELLINGLKAYRIDYCNYSVVGVTCDFIMSTYYFHMKDGSYISLRSDPWWGGKESVEVLNELVNTFFVFPLK